MTINPYDFAQLIAPVTPKDFFDHYWEKKPLVLTKRKTRGYKRIISLKDIDTIVSSLPPSMAGFPTISLTNNKKVQRFHIDDYLNADAELLCRSKVLSSFAEGNTLTLYRMHRFWQPVRKLCQGLEKVFGHHIGVDLFLSPQSAQGFNAHYDPHDVFILQIEGKKIWKIYGQLAKYPLVEEGIFASTDDLGKPLYEVELEPGDFLYIPRGFVHEVCTDQDYSLHMAVTIDVFTWGDVLREMINAQPEMRKALPIGLLNKSGIKKVDKTCLDHLREALAKETEVDAAFKKIKSRFMKIKKHPRQGGYQTASLEEAVHGDTRYQKKRGLECNLTTDTHHAILHFEDDEVVGPLYIEPLLKHIIENAQFSLRTLPNTVNKSGKVALIQRLVKVGVVVPSKKRRK